MIPLQHSLNLHSRRKRVHSKRIPNIESRITLNRTRRPGRQIAQTVVLLISVSGVGVAGLGDGCQCHVRIECPEGVRGHDAGGIGGECLP